MPKQPKADSSPLPIEEALRTDLEPSRDVVQRLTENALVLKPHPNAHRGWVIATALLFIGVSVAVFWMFASVEKHPKPFVEPVTAQATEGPTFVMVEPEEVVVVCDDAPAHKYHRCFDDESLYKARPGSQETQPSAYLSSRNDDPDCPIATDVVVITDRCGPLRALGPRMPDDFDAVRVFSVGESLVVEDADGTLAIWTPPRG